MESNNKVYTISISVWITSINAHRVRHSSCWWKWKRQYSSEILTSKITKLEKLQEARMQVIKTVGIQ